MISNLHTYEIRFSYDNRDYRGNSFIRVTTAGGVERAIQVARDHIDQTKYINAIVWSVNHTGPAGVIDQMEETK